jgi:hypothetical protein
LATGGDLAGDLARNWPTNVITALAREIEARPDATAVSHGVLSLSFDELGD